MTKRRMTCFLLAICIIRWVSIVSGVSDFSTAAIAQANSGTITGQVIGLSGEEVAKAPVEVRNVNSGQLFRAVSSGNGNYSISELPAGKYQISSPVAGFERNEIEVHAGEIRRVDLHYIEVGVALGTIGDGDLGTRLALYNRPPPPAGSTPRTANGQPDLSGYWLRVNTEPTKAQLQPWAEALLKYRIETDRKDIPSTRCVPVSVAPADQMLIQTPTYLVILMEASPQSHRLIFLDGRGHPKESDSTWYGHAIGAWDGDTLVVDRVGFNEGSWLDPSGLPHTSMLHLVERYRRLDLGHLEIETTIEDPAAYIRPWTRKTSFELKPRTEVEEFVCNENNLDAGSLK